MNSCKILNEAVRKARMHVINQSRYQLPCDYAVNDDWYEKADEMTDEETERFLDGKGILSDDSLLELIADLSLEYLYDGDGWVDGVAEYIIKHKDDCEELWAYVTS